MNGTMRLSRFQETAIYPKSQCKERIRRNFPKHFFYSHEVSFFLFSLLNLTSFVYLHHHHHRLLLLLLQEIKRRRKYPCSKMYFQGMYSHYASISSNVDIHLHYVPLATEDG
ncbi:hypothetical protein VNO77_23488 [Canavalia gladiata]|uniref:Uncharacterized protein n=1 Tax=Canavalia gladiata TaxID=3824 RepID=A0AAN9Q8Z4_CANGL